MSRKFEYFDRNKRPKLENPKWQEDYISYEIKQIKKSTGPNPEDFEIEDVVEEHKTNINDFINSFAKDVGVENVLKKIALTGDLSLLNQKEAIHADMSVISDDAGENFKMMKSVEQAYKAIDPELTKGQSAEDFIKSLSEEKINAYIEAKVNAKLKEKESKAE